MEFANTGSSVHGDAGASKESAKKDSNNNGFDKGGSVVPKQDCPHIFEAFDVDIANQHLDTTVRSTCQVRHFGAWAL
jgi:hypothetical protein